VHARREGSSTPCGSNAKGFTPPSSPNLPHRVADGSAATGLLPGHHLLRPSVAVCFIDRSDDISGEEDSLATSLLVRAGNGRRDIPIAEARRAFLALPGVRAGDFELRPSHPDNFLLLPASAGVRDLLLGARPVVVHGTTLVLHPWTRLAHATRVELFFKVKLEIVGIPPHAWSRDTASKILAPACWIEKVDAASADKTDQSFFGVTAWTNDPSAIPRSVSLLIAENELRVVHSDEVLHLIFDHLPSYLRKKVTLKYGVMVHLREVEDLAPCSSSSSSSPSLSSSDDDSGLGENPGRRFLSSGRGWGSRRWRFPCSRGVPDGGSASGGAGPPANGGVGENAGGARELSASGELAGQGSKAVALSSDQPVVGASRDGPCFPSGDSWEAVFLESLVSHSPSGLSTLESGAALLLDPMLDEAGQRHVTALPVCLPETVDVPDRDASHELSPSLGEPLASSLEPCTGVDTLVLGPTSAAGLVGEAAGVSVDVGVGGGAVSSGARPASETRPADLGGAPAQECALRSFIDSIQATPRPLLGAPPLVAPATIVVTGRGQPILPPRSRRIAAQQLAGVPVYKRGEVLLMRKFGILKDGAPVTAVAKDLYDSLYRSELKLEHINAIRELFPDRGSGTSTWPGDVVDACSEDGAPTLEDAV
jgi:hypothetical protein